MKIGVPKEIKDREFRVGLTPASTKVLIEQNHQVFIEDNGGLGSGFTNEDYEKVGANIVDAQTAWNQELIIKVKEPLSSEYQYIYSGQILFTYLHLAADRTLTEFLLKSGVTGIAYETVQLSDGRLPLLTPMSIIAGRLSVQIGARYLEKQQGGKGILLGGMPGVTRGNVVILGGGIVGTEAAKIAVGMGAKVTILDVNIDRLSYLETLFGSRVELLYSNSQYIAQSVKSADLLIGAVLITGRKAPILVSRELVQQMAHGSVIMDVAVDQGGCIETLRTTSHSDPSYVEEGVIHLGIPNLPGAVPRTATQALNNNTLPYIIKLANQGIGALKQDVSLAQGLNVQYHRLVHPAVQQVFPDLAIAS
ncbi:alanine dehydrogenase [Geminocystis sp. NIES-3709]|uniref:alanine dehydrogenase n=1 Tax=Geminocystis sp. NIES-3709 TaxID=1617448 RepID=UPI0005FC4E15|nr:alanine dehydrogenase [Geminocystis sp. NIES-3709]BAQ65646.1 alanine dehydrogenase [Geminocystis sp. NIES-3709]